MLEYESIPGVVSTLRRFKSEQKKSEDIITVKDITNKVTSFNWHFISKLLAWTTKMFLSVQFKSNK